MSLWIGMKLVLSVDIEKNVIVYVLIMNLTYLGLLCF